MSGSTCPTGCASMSCGFSGGIGNRYDVGTYDPSDFALRLDSSYLEKASRKQKEWVAKLMTDLAEQGKRQGSKKSSWWWPGVVATTLAGAAAMAFRGCWHSRMSWPVGEHGYSYQVCLSCGAKRLFDEKRFCAYGPFRYDLNQLILWQRSTQLKSQGGVPGDARRPS